MTRLSKIRRFSISITGLFVLSAAIGISLANSATNSATKNTDSADIEKSTLPLEDIEKFVEVFSSVKKYYIEPLSDEQLLQFAIRGMVEELDSYSTYVEGQNYDDIVEDTQGKFGGLGIRVTDHKLGLKIITPIDNTPASDAGILAGDVIVKIDGKRLSTVKRKNWVGLLRGEVGSKVNLLLLRAGEDKPLKKEIIREYIQQNTITSDWLEKGIGYIRISQFQAATAGDFREALFRFQEEQNKNMTGLIVDLRNNPGGLLTSAVSISDAFLDAGVIVSTKSRQNSTDRKFEATAKDLSNGVNLVLLINGGSASAAEIVAGALQDNKRATIVGEQSYGKGSVQSVINLSDTSALKLTTSQYYTPNDRSINSIGIMPDIIVKAESFSAPFSKLLKKGNVSDAEKTAVLQKDEQLKKALEFLKKATL